MTCVAGLSVFTLMYSLALALLMLFSVGDANKFAYEDCLFNSEWICKFRTVASWSSIVLVVIVAFILYVKYKDGSLSSGFGTESLILTFLGSIVALMWLVLAAGVLKDWTFLDINFRFGDDTISEFDEMYKTVIEALSSAVGSLLLWMLLVIIHTANAIPFNIKAIGKVIPYSIAMASGLVVSIVTISKGYTHTEVINNSTNVTCGFASNFACRFVIGGGFSAAVVYEILIAISLFVTEKFLILVDLPMAAVFLSSGAFLLFASDDFANHERSAKYAVCAIAFLGSISLIISSLVDIVKYCRKSCCSNCRCSCCRDEENESLINEDPETSRSSSSALVITVCKVT